MSWQEAPRLLVKTHPGFINEFIKLGFLPRTAAQETPIVFYHTNTLTGEAFYTAEIHYVGPIANQNADDKVLKYSLLVFEDKNPGSQHVHRANLSIFNWLDSGVPGKWNPNNPTGGLQAELSIGNTSRSISLYASYGKWPNKHIIMLNAGWFNSSGTHYHRGIDISSDQTLNLTKVFEDGRWLRQDARELLKRLDGISLSSLENADYSKLLNALKRMAQSGVTVNGGHRGFWQVLSQLISS